MKSLHFRAILMILAALAAFTSAGFSAQDSSVAVIDPLKALETSTEGQKAMAQLQAKQMSIRDELSQIDKDVGGIEKRLRTQRLTLTQETQEKLILDLDRLRIKRKRVEEDSLKEYQRLEFQLLNRFKQEMIPIIETVAKVKGFSLVLDLSTTGVAYYDRTLDITEDVVKLYNSAKNKEKEGGSKQSFNIWYNWSP